ncbi:YfhO family protein [Bacteroidota bacterium]
MIDVVFPFRYFLGECIQHGEFPLWNPFQQLGYPIHADMQSPTFYPETWIIGYLFGYTNYTLHFLFIFYTTIGGWGVYKLCRYSGANATASLITGIAFSLSGFFTGHAQALFALISAAWIPFILLNYLKFSNGYQLRDMVKASIFMFLLISNGYQTFTIILTYILALILAYLLINQLVKKDFKAFKRLIYLNTLFLIITLFLSLPSLVSTIQSIPYLDRAEGLPLQSIMINPLSPQSLVSLAIPFATVKNPTFFNTDMSMSNVYIGLILFLFAVSYLLRKNKFYIVLILSAALLCLTASFGNYTPVRKFLSDYFPLMNLFRFPSYFSYFSQLAFLLFAGLGLTQFMMKHQKEQKKLFWLSLFTILLLVSVFVFSLSQFESTVLLSKNIISDFHGSLNKSTFFEHIWIHSLIQISFLLGFVVLIYSKREYIRKLIPLLIVVEMIISVQLNIFYTGVSHKKPKVLKEQIDQLPQDFPIPSSKIINQNDGSRVFLPVWRNTGIFYKEVHYDAFSSFWLKDYNELFNNYPKLSHAILNNELVYLTDQVFPIESLSDSLIQMTDHKKIFVQDYIYYNDAKSSPEDTCFISNFSPNRIGIKSRTKYPMTLCLLQTDYPGWDVYVDGKKDEVKRVNFLYMAVQLASGEHSIVFEYNNSWIKTTFLVSYAFLLLLLLFLGWTSVFKRKA